MPEKVHVGEVTPEMGKVVHEYLPYFVTLPIQENVDFGFLSIGLL